MAVTIVQSGQRSYGVLYTVTLTADGDADITIPDHSISGMTVQSDGTDGGGTLTMLVSNDGTNFVAASFSTAADPRNSTMVASATASGAWTIPSEILSFRHFRFHLTGSTTPVLVLSIAIEYQAR